jgi:hypothetical protein
MMFALAVSLVWMVGLSYLVSTTQEWSWESKSSLFSNAGVRNYDIRAETPVGFLSVWLLGWPILCSVILVATPLVARARGGNALFWGALTGIWMGLPTPFAANAQRFWWNTFEVLTSGHVYQIDLLAAGASLLVLAVPMWSLMIHLTKTAWDEVCPTYPSLQKSAS